MRDYDIVHVIRNMLKENCETCVVTVARKGLRTTSKALKAPTIRDNENPDHLAA